MTDKLPAGEIHCLYSVTVILETQPVLHIAFIQLSVKPRDLSISAARNYSFILF
jgi:hypothetical protein